ncbi:hypothetical protein NDU88_003693 [Pleurodeles waltl]|uniref:Uncharacterized protein n=1 Tax=Pleurodeles waltl TaxID=8319 RepID=A0AAV7VGH5_PLEWA|nr:hypothetical protein NDU88_003693 [Pleurodeles waltl]
MWDVRRSKGAVIGVEEKEEKENSEEKEDGEEKGDGEEKEDCARGGDDDGTEDEESPCDKRFWRTGAWFLPN